MTKKHYEAIAQVFRAYISTGTGTNIAKPMAKDLADYFEQDNPKFNRERFLQSCGIKQHCLTCNDTGTLGRGEICQNCQT